MKKIGWVALINIGFIRLLLWKK